MTTSLQSRRVEIFRTNIEDHHTAQKVARTLSAIFCHSLVTFDLDDCDRILRVQGDFSIHQVIEEVTGLGYDCVKLE
jgi:hypothetical protein